MLKYTVVKALQGRAQGVKFWEIKLPAARVELKRARLDVDELIVGMPRTSMVHEFEFICDSSAADESDLARDSGGATT